MFKKIAAIILVLVIIQTGFAQTTKPDFTKIEKDINDKASPLFYATLLKRYTDNDTTLTRDEYIHLYYGFSMQDNYSPYGKPSVNDALKKALDADKTDKIIELEKKALTEYPFNIRDLYVLSTTLVKKGDTTEGNIYHKKMIEVVKTILSTGNGAADSTAMYVVSVDHEYDLISLLGYKFGSSQALVQTKDGPADKMALQKNEDNLDYLYFNVSRLFASMEKMFKKKN